VDPGDGEGWEDGAVPGHGDDGWAAMTANVTPQNFKFWNVTTIN
jgi:hypothetical protein